MMIQLKNTFRRSQNTLLQDAAGLAAMLIIMFVALHLPAVT
ncbi:MAG: hypothetical protein ACI9BH_002644 [Paracoccaceae bacterium]|jgi:hypothetical protein